MSVSRFSFEYIELINASIQRFGKKTNYGMGFRSGKDDQGVFWFGHSGGSVGGITQFVVYPEEKIVVAIVTNSSEVRHGKLPYKLAGLF